MVLPAACAGLLSTASTAHAYTINTTEVGKPIRWAIDTVHLQVDSEFERFLEDGHALSALVMGFDAWRGLPRVPDLLIEQGDPESLGHHDGRSTNGVYLLREWPYEPTKLAVTVVTYEMDTGRLLDADIVVNGKANFALLPEPAQPGEAKYDLAGVLTHEAGHVLGLGESDASPLATMWPYARPDDTDKRSLDQDDEDGAIDSYLGAPPAAANGCGFNSVGGRTSGRAGAALVAGMVLWLLALRAGRPRRRKLLVAASGVSCALLVGFDGPAADGGEEETQILTLERLARTGTRADRTALEQIASGGDRELARRAHVTLGLVLARPASERIGASHPAARQRLAQLQGNGATLRLGRTQRLGTVVRAGLFFTEYAVRTPSGETIALRVAGGARAGIGQRVIDAEPPPADAQEIVVSQQQDGSQRWAYHAGDVVFGGDLGDGAAITGAL